MIFFDIALPFLRGFFSDIFSFSLCKMESLRLISSSKLFVSVALMGTGWIKNKARSDATLPASARDSFFQPPVRDLMNLDANCKSALHCIDDVFYRTGSTLQSLHRISNVLLLTWQINVWPGFDIWCILTTSYVFSSWEKLALRKARTSFSAFFRREITSSSP